ncbi:helix-turn-helix transcriptional regulator [Acidocella facilis]|uniref:helix-turn-helix transcriptional regulator n=1 Tax=Acidocella facilis TaxID=525 RepID=UPI001F3D82E0|nr:LuxR C-terminal-related transcriptional regulator [Acidocella facilis]
MGASGSPIDGVNVSVRMSGRRTTLTKGRLYRNRLDLEGRQGCKALVFRAPRGFGKSVQVALSADAALQRGENCVYLDLSSPRSCGLSEAESIADAILRALAPTVSTNFVDEADLAARALSALANEVNRVTICLDGVVCCEESCGRLLEALVLETPATLRLVIAGHEKTNLTALSLLPGVQTVGPAELAFDRAEAVSFTGGDAAAAEAMLASTGGWPALCAFMQMAAPANIPIEDLPETRAFFEGEILVSLETPLREFLMNACMLEAITPLAYDYVFKTRDAARSMIRLTSEFGLLTPSAESRYELNPVLRRYLRSRFTVENGGRCSYILKRVAFWHWSRGELRYAIAAALWARDLRWIRNLKEDLILDLVLRQGEIDALCRWVADMPRSMLLGTPGLALGYAWALYFSQRATAADDVLTALVRKDTSHDVDLGGSTCYVPLVRAIGKATNDEMILSEQLCRDWLRDYGADSAIGKAAALTCLAFIEASDRRFGSLNSLIQSASSASRLARHRYAFGWIAATRVQAELFRGDMHAAHKVLIEACESIDVAAGRTPFSHGMLEAFALQIDSEGMSVHPGEERLRKVLAFVMDFGVTDIAWGTVRCCAETLIETNNQASAFSLIEECRFLAHKRRLRRLVMLAQLGAAGLALASDVKDINDALPEPADLSFLPNQNRALQAEIELLKAMRYLRDDKAGLADYLARKALSAFTAVSDRRGQIRALYVLAVARHLLQEDTLAFRHIADADLLVHQFGCLGTLRKTRLLLLAVCPPATRFLEQIISFNPLPIMVTKPRLLDARRSDDISVRLTSKQIGILRYAAHGLTSKEIAERLYVTEDAVKWHFRKIFHLLSVTSRTQAVAAAHERGLL